MLCIIGKGCSEFPERVHYSNGVLILDIGYSLNYNDTSFGYGMVTAVRYNTIIANKTTANKTDVSEYERR